MQSKTKGIVLSETNYSETSKILNILTEDYGLIGVISKGSRKLKSKLRGVSNKLNYCEYTISYKENGLSTLIEGSMINSLKNIYLDFNKAGYSYYLIDLIYQVLKENNNKKLFNLLESSLIKRNYGLNPILIALIVEIKLLEYCGVCINLDSCALCGNTDDLYTVDINQGGVICKNCYKEGYVFDARALKLLTILAKINLSEIKSLEITDDTIIHEINDFIKEYYNYYTGIYLKKVNVFNL